jgi:hypothetical protein
MGRGDEVWSAANEHGFAIVAEDEKALRLDRPNRPLKYPRRSVTM